MIKHDDNIDEIKIIEEQLMKVYDPEFPSIDIFNMWLIYDIKSFDDKINILMTFSTPNCPLWDIIIDMTKESIKEKFPNKEIIIDLTFDPLWSIEMMKDEDLKRLFQ